MRNPYISIFSTHNLPAKTKELGALWELFVSNGLKEIVSEKLRKNILDSWKRCQNTGIDPLQLQTNPALNDAELMQVLQHSELFQVAKPIMDDLFYKMAGTGFLATLADQNGRILYLKGDSSVLRQAEKMNFAPGMDWSENAAGTNAIGTSIVTNSPIQIFSAEHFCQGCHPWTCSSAPITHPFTKELIGVIDFTGFWDHAQPHTLGLAISTAQAIEMELTQVYMKVNHFLTEFFYKQTNKWINETILVVNHAFFVVNCSENLKKLFQFAAGASLLDHPLFYPIVNELSSNSSSKNQNEMIREISIQDFTIQIIESISFMGEIAGYMMIFKDKKSDRMPSLPLLQKEPWTEMIGSSKAFLSALVKCSKASLSNVPILILGESGTGKERIAQLIHRSSRRAGQPFIAINCGAIQKELIGSELFGYERGTFTGGAREGKKGKFEEANDGTLFLDEIGEMPLELQVHLLRVLQEKEITRLGSSVPISVNVRIIAATNKNLYELSKKGLFREDLLFRLNVVTVDIPPLRDRREDITSISEFFLSQFAQKYQKNSLSLSEEILNFFFEYNWPGNVRELLNVLEHAAIFCDSPVISLDDLPDYLFDQSQYLPSIQNHPVLPPAENEEQKILKRLLKETNWNLTAVAKKMKIARTTLYRKLKKYQLK